MKISYNGKRIDLLKFLKSKKYSVEEKLNTFTSNQPGLERIQRKFAVACAWRAAERADKNELYEFIGLIQTMYESVDYANIDDLKDDDYRAASLAASLAVYWAADSSTERKIQLEMLIEMAETEGK